MNFIHSSGIAPYVVTVNEPRIDSASAIEFKDAMRNSIPNEVNRVVLDLSRVEFIDSSGLGAIVASKKALKDRKLDLSGLTPMVEKVFRLTRMDTLFDIYASNEDAKRGLL